MAKTLKAAAVQMKAVLGNVAANLEKADRLVEEAARKGAQIIILPEFFTSAAAFHPSMLDAVLPLNGKAYRIPCIQGKKAPALCGRFIHRIKIRRTLQHLCPGHARWLNGIPRQGPAHHVGELLLCGGP